jgi:putative methionine-R-sulfoxide reductase with GAF domain
VRNRGSLSSLQIPGMSAMVALRKVMPTRLPVCYGGTVEIVKNPLLAQLEGMVSARDRGQTIQEIAVVLRRSGNYRWAGLHDVDHAAGLVKNVAWNGTGTPEYPAFPLTKGLTSAAIAQNRSINVGDASADPRYLTAFGSTRSEIIVPIFDSQGETVVGTIDVKSEQPNAFSLEAQDLLAAFSDVIKTLWKRWHRTTPSASSFGPAPIKI